MQTTCWRLTGFLALLWMVVLFSAPVHAAGLQDGIHGMVWGGHAGDYPRLEKAREAGGASYYVDRQMSYHAVGQPVSAVIYGFFRGQLFAAYIKLSSPNQAYYLEKHFNTDYGPAKVTTVGSGAQTIYRWEDGDLKIKLKNNEAGGEIKLGIYYQPLSTELNQTLVEEGPTDVEAQEPSGDKAPEAAPLL